MTRLGARSRPSIIVEGVERAVELLSWRLTSEEGDWDIASPAPDRLWYLECEAWQDTTRGSLWRFTRNNSGAEVAYVVRPHGNAIPSIDAPHYRGRLIVGPKPDLGGDTGSRWFPFAFTWLILGEPEEVTE